MATKKELRKNCCGKSFATLLLLIKEFSSDFENVLQMSGPAYVRQLGFIPGRDSR